MDTNLSLDPGRIERAVEASGERTKKVAVTRTLEEFIARRAQKGLMDFMGKREWDESFDYKAECLRRRPRSSTPASGRSPFTATRQGHRHRHY